MSNETIMTKALNAMKGHDGWMRMSMYEFARTSLTKVIQDASPPVQISKESMVALSRELEKLYMDWLIESARPDQATRDFQSHNALALARDKARDTTLYTVEAREHYPQIHSLAVTLLALIEKELEG